MTTPFLVERRRLSGHDVHLLPTASVVLAARHSVGATQWVLLMPHRTVRVLPDVVECMSLSPNFIKCLIGEPRRHLGVEYAATTHPMLSPFAAAANLDDAIELLQDLRRSLEVTGDEHDFLALWSAPLRTGAPLPTSDRQAQRLCLRFAGQSPKAINTTLGLARTLDADNRSGLYNGLGLFADASHFARVCRSYTGSTPATWRNMSQTFY